MLASFDFCGDGVRATVKSMLSWYKKLEIMMRILCNDVEWNDIE